MARPFLSDHTQVVQVLQFQDLTIEQDAVVPVPPWNGETGGILFVTVAGTLDSQGLIDGYGAGFRGGDHHDGSFDFGCEGLENDRAGTWAGLDLSLQPILSGDDPQPTTPSSPPHLLRSLSLAGRMR